MDSVLQSRKGRKISLTALIDVVFILLMFFMLTSTFSQWKALPLPAAKASAATSDELPALILVYSNGDIRVLKDSLSPVLESFEEVLTTVGDKAIVISAEENAKVKSVLSLVDQLNASVRTFTLGQPFASQKVSE
jgi:biopolymer transport protein ExbD